MAAYIVATIRITDPIRFADYGKAIAGMSERFGGQSIVKGPVVALLEGGDEGGGDPGERVVVTRFPDADSARGYIGSPEYRAARATRAGAATVTMRLLEDSA